MSEVEDAVSELKDEKLAKEAFLEVYNAYIQYQRCRRASERA